MANYYFVGTFIPALQVGMLPEITVESYSELLKENLNALDYEEVKQLKRLFDLENIRSFWVGQPLNNYGNFNENSFEEAMVSGIGLPEYVYSFMARYENNEERLRHFARLYTDFFKESSSGFLKRFFKQERAIHLILVAFRAKKFQRSLLHELQYEDPSNELVARILVQKDAKSYEPPKEFLELKALYEKFSDKPFELHQALVLYRFYKLEELIGLQVFTLDRLLAYYFQLVLCHQWMALNREKGKQMIHTIVKGIS